VCAKTAQQALFQRELDHRVPLVLQAVSLLGQVCRSVRFVLQRSSRDGLACRHVKLVLPTVLVRYLLLWARLVVEALAPQVPSFLALPDSAWLVLEVALLPQVRQLVSSATEVLQRLALACLGAILAVLAPLPLRRVLRHVLTALLVNINLVQNELAVCCVPRALVAMLELQRARNVLLEGFLMPLEGCAEIVPLGCSLRERDQANALFVRWVRSPSGLVPRSALLAPPGVLPLKLVQLVARTVLLGALADFVGPILA